MNQSTPMAIRNDEDQRLALRAREGCRDSFGALVTRHQMAVRTLLWRIIGREDEVDDVAQEVFISALRGMPKVRLDSSFRTWLLAIARNQAISHLRKRTKARETAVDQIEIIFNELCESQIQHETSFESQLELLQECLNRLAQPHRMLIQQTYFDERTPSDLAESTDANPGTIRMRLMRIRRALADCIKNQQAG